MNRIFCLLAIVCPILLNSQTPRPPSVHGKVYDKEGHVLSGASLHLLKSGARSGTGRDGAFSMKLTRIPDTLEISYTGYLTRQLPLTLTELSMDLKIELAVATANLEEVVVNTGYQTLNRERATGSFVQIDNALLNRRVSTNVLERLDGVAPGVVFQKPVNAQGSLPSNEKLGISIRGRSTIDDKVSADPLVIVDNFPYEGNISNLNPNDIESITILKDAAAAAIWGSRSGNGVIVITTKKSTYHQKPKITFNTNLTRIAKPDLFYSRNYLPSSEYIGIETFLFSKGYFDADLNSTTTRPPITPAVEILARKRAGQITDAEATAQLQNLFQTDVRNDFTNYVYQPSVLQQYSLNLSGGSQHASYLLSAGYDQNRDALIRNGNNRFTLHANNHLEIAKNLELTADLLYTHANTQLNNANGFDNVAMGGSKYGGIYPYASLADASGNPLPITKDYRSSFADSMQTLGFLDWRYRPLDEIGFSDNTSKLSDLVIRTTVTYRFAKHFRISVYYQNEKQQSFQRNYQSIQTYYARNLINRFSQRNATTGVFSYPFPKGGILSFGNNELVSDNLRTQLEFNRNLTENQVLNLTAGAEIKKTTLTGYNRNAYGYDDKYGTAISNLNYSSSIPVNPVGSSTISAPEASVSGSDNRFVSWYMTALYTLEKKYTLSLSGRQDGANIFGVNTNDRITPLWSAGLGWNLSKESFYHLQFLPYVRFRASYGYNGNVYNASAYLTAVYRSSNLTGLPYASISSPPNPSLRWERVRNQNLGIDFATKNNRVSGNVEWYQKLATDLIEAAPLAPSTGFTSFKGNAATLQTRGFDLSVQYELLQNKGKSSLGWNINLFVSKSKDKVEKFDTKYLASSLTNSVPSPGTPAATGIYAVEGNSLFGIYSYRWAGLDPATGDPQGYLDGSVSKDYLNIINNASLDNIVYHGSSRPVFTSAIRNTFNWKHWSLSVNITGKFGYYFRNRSTSLNYQQVLLYPHADYIQRWQQPGDELTTQVPSLVYPSDNNRNLFYQNASILVEKADHIRLQDIALSYNWPVTHWKNLPVEQLQLYMYAANPGILWRANKKGLDPDTIDNIFTTASPAPFSIAIGIKLQFK